MNGYHRGLSVYNSLHTESHSTEKNIEIDDRSNDLPMKKDAFPELCENTRGLWIIAYCIVY